MELRRYMIWIEAEQWEPSDWDPADCNSDVIVSFSDGARWVGSFFTYANIATLTAKNRLTGECLGGRYFWASDMILVDELSRKRVEQIVAHLIEEGTLSSCFQLCA